MKSIYTCTYSTCTVCGLLTFNLTLCAFGESGSTQMQPWINNFDLHFMILWIYMSTGIWNSINNKVYGCYTCTLLLKEFQIPVLWPSKSPRTLVSVMFLMFVYARKGRIMVYRSPPFRPQFHMSYDNSSL